ncbi:type II toxin-antitoxin system RelE/ParE family toxin [Planctomycetota bacterium]
MSLPVRLSEEAEADLRAAMEWYDERQPGLGERFLDAVKAALQMVAANPAIGSRPPGVEDRDAKRVLVRRFPYAVVYYLTDQEIRVVAVAHGRRRPGYWRGRR